MEAGSLSETLFRVPMFSLGSDINKPSSLDSNRVLNASGRIRPEVQLPCFYPPSELLMSL